MTPQEVKRNLVALQTNALALIVSLTMLNRDTSSLLAAMDTFDADLIVEGLSAMRKSSECVADSLEAFCDSAQFLI